MIFKKSGNIFAKGAILLTIFMLVISSFLFLPQKAQAQFLTHDVPKAIGDAIKWAWEKGGAVAYRNALNFFLQQAAQQTGEWLATGDQGKKPAFLTDPDFYTKVGDQMLGEFINAAADDFLDMNLCETLDPTIKFNILAGLDPEYQKMKWAKEPKCSFSQIKKNLEDASKKNLFEFSSDVKEGKVAKHEATVSTLIQGDSVLTRDIKNVLDGKIYFCPDGVCPDDVISFEYALGMSYYDNDILGIGAYLHTATQIFEQELNKIEKLGEKITENEKQLIERELKALSGNSGYIDKNIWGGDKNKDSLFWVSDKLLYWGKHTAQCAKQSADTICGYAPEGSADFCGITCYGINLTDCDGSNCLAIIKRANKYTKQLIEWATTLQDMIAKVIKNWEDQKGLPDLDPLEDAENMLNPESNAMGIQMGLESKLFDKQMKAIEKSKTFRQIQGSMNAITSKVSGLVKLPSTIVSEKTRKLVDAGDASALTYTGVALADAIGVFANSFLTNFMKKLMKGLNPAVDSSKVKVPKDPNEPLDPDTTSILSEIKVIPINQTSKEMTIYDEFAVCPTGIDQKYTSSWGCLLDNKLARAVEERITIQEAMDNNLFDSGQAFGASIGTLSPSNIKKLRRIGVFPLGIEIASNIIDKQGLVGVTLGDVVQGFDQRGADKICGNNDAGGESLYCNLVDPNWVLKAPSYLCEITSYSAIPLRDSSFRQESCLDLKTCINESENNQCDTWSYCTREKNIWRFGGDECDSQYNTCTSYFEANGGEIFSYLSNTLDFENCNSSNVGCKWYCSNWDQTYSGIGGSWSCLSPGWRKYTCNLDQGLCREFLCIGGDNDNQPCAVDSTIACPGGACNRLNPNYTGGICNCVCDGDNGCPNGLGNCSVVEGAMSCSLDRPELRNVAFFSNHVGECKEADQGCSQYIRAKSGLGVNFLPNGSFELPAEDNDTPFGWKVVKNSALIQQILPSSNAQNGSNVVQIQAAVSDCRLSQVVDNVPLHGDFVLYGYYKKNSDNLSGDNDLKLKICYDSNCTDSDEIEENIELDDNNWELVSVSLSSNKEKNIDHLEIFAFDATDFEGDIYIDSLQLRNETGNSTYREYGSKGITYLKSAPAWMNCYNTGINDDSMDPDCFNFIQKCAQKDVGCELYTPVDDGFPIPAITNNRDSCEIDCLGYETFQERPTNFDDNQRLVDLIPSTAKKCSAPGCEEFTNLDAISVGGEGREYYTYLRKCVKTNSQNQAIIDEERAPIDPPDADVCEYYYTWIGAETSGYQLRKYYLKEGADGPEQLSGTPNIEWGDCEDENDADVNPHCRQFYDAQGNVFYRFYKNTITCSQDCSPYRRAIDDTIQMAIGTEGEVCSANDIGCREYKGTAYGNMRNLFLDRFLNSTDPWENVEISYESISYLGQSIKANGAIVNRHVANSVKQGKTYSLSLWVKGSGDYVASFGDDLYFIPDAPHNISVVSNDWQEIRFGSIYFNREVEADVMCNLDNICDVDDGCPCTIGAQSCVVHKGNDSCIIFGEKLKIQGPYINEDNSFYLDNIVLNEVQDNIYLIKDSWNTPRICDIDQDGNFMHGYAVGCQAYWGRDDSLHYLKSFSRLCSEEAVGCEVMIDTQNSSSPFREEFNNGSPQGDEIVISADSLVYRVYDTDKSCAMENKGCQRFGLPELDSNQEAINFTDVYLLNNPDLYNLQSTLCDIEGEGCQEYEGNIYFKDPINNSCEYRTNSQQDKNGWFKKGTDHPCYIENGFAYQPYGTTYGIRTNDDSLYEDEGRAGICPGSQSGCTEFINPIEQNLVINGGFEENDDNWQGDDIVIVDNGCLAGHCLKAEVDDVYQNISGNYRVGDIYQLSAWLKTDGAGIEVKTILQYVGANGAIINDKEVVYSGSTAGKWKKQVVEFVAPSGATKIQIKFEPTINAGEEALIDNVYLVGLNSNRGKYYYLNNNELDQSSCSGMVGLKDGCVLFYNTSMPIGIWDSFSTYSKGQQEGDKLVAPINVQSNMGGEGDTNTILKVIRDRVCGEWLHCADYRSVWDSAISEYRQVCDSWVRCDKLIGSGEEAQCGHVVFDSNPSVLDKEAYIGRNISWSGMDYSGYSILDMYPVETLIPKEDNDISGLYELTYYDNNDDEKGVDGRDKKINKTTRIYPEKSSPFKESASMYYNKVNLCDSGVDHGDSFNYTKDNLEHDGDGNVLFRSLYPDCQGSYQKVEYGDQYSGLTKYYNFDAENVDTRKACKYSGKPCAANTNCVENGTDGDICISPNKVTKVMGLRGFCLEPDESKPEDSNACITWWPGITAGDMDVYNIHYSAGYVPNSEKKWYCASDDSNSIFGDAVAFGDVLSSACHTGVDGCEPKGSISFSRLLPTGVRIKRSEIDRITIEASGTDDSTGCEAWCKSESGDNKILEFSDKIAEAPWAVWAQYNVNNDKDRRCCNSYWGIDGCRVTGGSGSIRIRILFDGTDDEYADKMEIVCADDSSGKGGSCGWRNMNIYLKSGCQYLINTVTDSYGLSTAYTDRFWEYSSYYLDNNGAQECADYGVANVNQPDRLTFVGGPTNNCVDNYANIVYRYGNGSKDLRKKFIKVAEVREFFTDTMEYASSNSSLLWNKTNNLAFPSVGSDFAPKVASVQCDDDSCVEKTINKISIGNADSGDIISMLSLYVANLKFYAWADTNHMPIREISIDWDNSEEPKIYNVIAKNHRDECCEIESGCEEFGLTPQACVDKYYIFNHTYFCQDSGSPGWGEHGCIDMCCFKPKVYIKDNWGWCAGNPEGVYVGWDISATPEAPNNCKDWDNIPVDEAGISYDGLIKIHPGN